MGAAGLPAARGVNAVAEPIHEVAAPATPTPSELLAEEVQGSKEAVANFLELLRVLDEQGLLRTMTDFLRSNEEILRFAADWLSRPRNLRAVQNLRRVLETLDRVDPERLDRILTEVTEAVERAAAVEPAGPRLGGFAVMRQLGEPETNRGLRVLLAALSKFGTVGERESDDGS